MNEDSLEEEDVLQDPPNKILARAVNTIRSKRKRERQLLLEDVLQREQVQRGLKTQLHHADNKLQNLKLTLKQHTTALHLQLQHDDVLRSVGREPRR